MKTIYKFLLISFGIISFYTVHGFFLEKITKTNYGQDGEKFTYFQSLIGLSFAFYSFIAYGESSVQLGMSSLWNTGELHVILLLFHLQFVSGSRETTK